MVDFGDRLIVWYENNKRDLPWRRTTDPYKIWLSEIILQQTRVDQGLSYYLRFVEHYPDIYALAKAPQEEVFKHWQGLGYYNRAANMLTTAKAIVENHNGNFPRKRDQLLELKGIGNYTSAAIASFAFKEPVAVLDGNVYRLLSRIFGNFQPIHSTQANKDFNLIAAELLGSHPPDIFNQAIMEFGALFCKPRKPDCVNCIFRSNCFAFENNAVDKLPVKKAKIIQKDRYFYYFLVEMEQKERKNIYIKKRDKPDIWQNLYDFPMFESPSAIDPFEAIQNSGYFKLSDINEMEITSISDEYRHQLTHQKIHAHFLRLIVNKKIMVDDDNSLILIDRKNLINYPVPRLIERYLQDQKLIK